MSLLLCIGHFVLGDAEYQTIQLFSYEHVLLFTHPPDMHQYQHSSQFLLLATNLILTLRWSPPALEKMICFLSHSLKVHNVVLEKKF